MKLLGLGMELVRIWFGPTFPLIRCVKLEINIVAAMSVVAVALDCVYLRADTVKKPFTGLFVLLPSSLLYNAFLWAFLVSWWCRLGKCLSLQAFLQFVPLLREKSCSKVRRRLSCIAPILQIQLRNHASIAAVIRNKTEYEQLHECAWCQRTGLWFRSSSDKERRATYQSCCLCLTRIRLTGCVSRCKSWWWCLKCCSWCCEKCPRWLIGGIGFNNIIRMRWCEYVFLVPLFLVVFCGFEFHNSQWTRKPFVFSFSAGICRARRIVPDTFPKQL